MSTSLPASLQHPMLWQGRRRHDRMPTLATGHERLDRLLPGGGWPLGALTELLVEHDGVGELSLVLPTLARISREGGWAVLVDPPWTPYPPAIHGHGMDLGRLLVVRTPDATASLWACEQALRGVRGGVVLSWLRGRRHEAGFAHLRRLQLAARSGRKGAFLFRPASAAAQATPAALRLHLEAREADLAVTVLKCRGTHRGQQLRLKHRVFPEPRPERTARPVRAASSERRQDEGALHAPATHSTKPLRS
ncbi:MAG: translesion DNA synthesis-associated protein ImuA [Pseudomonadota bacterium]